jgi:hypothetical protein
MAAKAAFRYLQEPTWIHPGEILVNNKSDTSVAHLFESIPLGNGKPQASQSFFIRYNNISMTR